MLAHDGENVLWEGYVFSSEDNEVHSLVKRPVCGLDDGHFEEKMV